MPSDLADLAALDRAHLWHPFTQHAIWDGSPPLVIERAEGCDLIDTDGRRYLDGVSSLWTNVHGHGHPRLDAAIRDQLGRVAHTTLLGLSHPGAIRLAARLAALTGLPKVFFSDDGSTAAEIALKIAFQYQQQIGNPERTRFATLEGAYHGDTLGAVSVGSIPLFHRIYAPLLFGSLALPAPVEAGGEEEEACLSRALELLDRHGSELAALVVEPLVQGAAGMKMHSPAFLRAILTAARERGVLLVVDEVATGFGRTGTMFAFEQAGVLPDLLCVAKGLGAGYLPIAATLATERIFSAFLGAPQEYRQLFHGHTFTGNPLACAAALASLDLFEEERTLDRAAALADRLAGGLAGLRGLPGVGSIRQKGVMIGIDLVAKDGTPLDPALMTGHRVAMACRPQGAITRPLGDTLVLNPPLVLSDADADRLVGIVAFAIGSLPW